MNVFKNGQWFAVNLRTANHSRSVEELLNAGADVNAVDWYGNSLLDNQRQSASRDIEQILLEKGGQHGNTHTAEARISHLLDQVPLAEGEKRDIFTSQLREPGSCRHNAPGELLFMASFQNCRRNWRHRRCFPYPCILQLEDRGTRVANDPLSHLSSALR
jgi:hypothetical protein